MRPRIMGHLEHTLGYRIKLSNAFAQLEAAVSLQPLCMVGVRQSTISQSHASLVSSVLCVSKYVNPVTS